MSKIKYPSNVLKERMISLGLTQIHVAEAIGVDKAAMQKLEQRGELPEIHLAKMASILEVSVIDLDVEKYAPMIRAAFHIPTERFRQWVKENLETDRAFGHKVARLAGLDESGLPESHKMVLNRVRSLSPEEGFKTLVASGIYTADGNLALEYGGTEKKKV